MSQTQGRYSEDALGRIYDVLVKRAGARADEYERNAFVQCAFNWGHSNCEYRFQGNLGFGGKIWLPEHGEPYVNCYQEDETPERRKAMEEANEALKKLVHDALV